MSEDVRDHCGIQFMKVTSTKSLVVEARLHRWSCRIRYPFLLTPWCTFDIDIPFRPCIQAHLGAIRIRTRQKVRPSHGQPKARRLRELADVEERDRGRGIDERCDGINGEVLRLWVE